MKLRSVGITCLVVTLIYSLPVLVFAISHSQSFHVGLQSEGQEEISVTAGQEIPVTLTLERTDQTEEWNMYAWQTEIVFDPEAFELVEDSVHPANGVGSSFHPGNHESRLYFNAYSLSKAGIRYPASLEAGTFTLRALKEGSSIVYNDNYLVSTSSGMDRYTCSSSSLKVNSIPNPEGTDPNGSGAGNGSGTGTPEDFENGATGTSDLFRFKDVPMDAWYVDAVTYTVQRGLFKGVSETSFDPQGNMTRAMLVTVLHRLEGTPAASGSSGFEDVPSDTWYTDAVAWARESGVVEGYSDTQFGPDDFITREQMATILYRDSERKGQDVSKVVELSRYADEHEISDWARQAMNWANAEGLIIGRSENTLNPEDTATRAEVAMIIMRYCKWME